MNKDLIFIHIPKTGGTTINTALQNKYWQSEPDFNYRHILKDKKSNCQDIFEIKKRALYADYKIFMILRHPVDRIISEYYFIEKRQEFMKLIRNNPSNLKQYVESRQTQNYVVSFLLGQKMYDYARPNEADVAKIITTIEELPIYVGIFEKFEESLSYFSQELDISWPAKMQKKRIAFKRPSITEIDPEMEKLIVEANQLDAKLYDFALDRFNKVKIAEKIKIEFLGDKYDHVIAFSARACLLEFAVDRKEYIKHNFHFFKELNQHILNVLNIRDGRTYTQIWNFSFVEALKKQQPHSILTEKLSKIIDQNDDPLENTANIGATIDEVFTAPPQITKNSPLLFDKEDIVVPKVEKVSFLKKIFGR